jgi:protection-of-telomeres protein 1
MDNLPSNSQVGPPLPQGFRTIGDIRDLSNDSIITGTFVDIIGFTKDYQPPIQTRGSGPVTQQFRLFS